MQWILCSDRLPEYYDKPYYVDEDNELYDSDDVVICYTFYGEVRHAIGQCCYNKRENAREWTSDGDSSINNDSVLAWLPLPEFKAEV